MTSPPISRLDGSTPPAVHDRTDGRDLTLIERLEQLYVAVVSDCLDQLGIRDRVMEPHIRPLANDHRTAGYAATVRLLEVDQAPSDRSDWYRCELEAVEAVQPGDVIVVSTCPGAYWGELLATAARFRGVRGIVADAYTRDTLALLGMHFPTFVAGISAHDSLGRTEVEAHTVPISCGGVLVHPGDLVLADADGVVVVPADRADEVIHSAEAKLTTENEMRGRLTNGMPISEAFARYGIL